MRKPFAAMSNLHCLLRIVAKQLFLKLNMQEYSKYENQIKFHKLKKTTPPSDVEITGALSALYKNISQTPN